MASLAPHPIIVRRKAMRKACGYKRDWWTTKEHDLAVELRRNGMSYGKIGQRVLRTPYAVASRLRAYGEVERG